MRIGRTLYLLLLVLGLSGGAGLAKPPPLIRSSEQTASLLCLKFARPSADLVLLCRDALQEFRHSDYEMSRLHTNLGDALGNVERRAEARIEYHKAIKIMPVRNEPWRNLAWSFWNEGDYVAAEQAFRDALKIDTTAEALAGLGSSLRHQGKNREEAFKVFEQALLISPKYTWAMVELAWQHYWAHDYSAGTEMFRQALELDAYYGNAAYGLSWTLARSDDLQGALQAINQALKINDKSAVYMARRGLLQRLLGHKKRALEDGKRAIELNAEEEDGYIQTALALRDLGRRAEALEVLQNGIDAGAGDNYLHFKYADLLADEHRWQDALVQVDKALEFGDVDERDHNLRSYILINLGREADALAATRTALEFAPENTTAHLNGAYAEIALGREEQALHAMLAATQNGLDAADVNDFLAHLISSGHYGLAIRLRVEINKQAKADAP